MLVGHLPPASEYWYRFVDEEGNGSRIGRTLTAPSPDDPRPSRFAFVSCQDICEGYLNAYRRMIWEDERAAPEDRLGFVLHLGDFIYEVVAYPDQVKNGHSYDRLVTFPIKYPKGKVVAKNRFWVPDSLEDYRVAYHAYLQDPDLQDARARFPFVACGTTTNSPGTAGSRSRNLLAPRAGCPRRRSRSRRMQAWFEYQPARVTAAGPKLDTFSAPHVVDTLVKDFDDTAWAPNPTTSPRSTA